MKSLVVETLAVSCSRRLWVILETKRDVLQRTPGCFRQYLEIGWSRLETAKGFVVDYKKISTVTYDDFGRFSKSGRSVSEAGLI
jgi:hypothetical protein